MSITSATKTCPQVIGTNVVPTDCRFDSVEIWKEESNHAKKWKASNNIILISEDTYEIVAGDKNHALLNVKIKGLVVNNCDHHPENVFNLRQSNGKIISNQKPSEVYFLKRGYTMNSLFSSHVAKFFLSISSCVGTRDLDVFLYPDRVFNLKVVGKLVDDIPNGKLSAGLSFELGCKWDKVMKGKFTNNAKVIGSISRSKKTEWNLDVEGAWKSKTEEVKLNYTSFKSKTDLFIKCVRYKEEFDDLLYEKLFLKKEPKRNYFSQFPKLTSKAEFEYENLFIEDKNSLKVYKRHKYSIIGTIFELKWTKDLSSMLLKSAGGFFGWFLAEVNQTSKELEYGGLTIEASISGGISVNVSFSYDERNGTKTKWQCSEDDPSIKGFAKFTFLVQGEIRVNMTTYGIKFEVKRVGVDVSLNLKKEQLEFTFTGCVLSVEVYYSTEKTTKYTNSSASAGRIPEGSSNPNKVSRGKPYELLEKLGPKEYKF